MCLVTYWVVAQYGTRHKVLTCSASTQVTTTTLQKNLTEKIKWYMATLWKSMNNIFLAKHVYRKNIIHKKILSTKKKYWQKKCIHKKNLNNMSWSKIFWKNYFQKTRDKHFCREMQFRYVVHHQLSTKWCFSSANTKKIVKMRFESRNSPCDHRKYTEM